MTTTRQTASAVNAQISELIANSTPTVRQRYVDGQAEKEVQARTETLAKAMDKVKSLKSEINKVKPDETKIKVVNGEEIKEEFFTPATLKTKKENIEKLQKLEKALENYLNDETVDDPNKAPYKVLVEVLAKS